MADNGNDDLKSQASGLRSHPLRVGRRQARAERFRYWFYLGLLVFVVAAGLPMVGVPALRQRLSTRAQALKDALRPNQGPAPLMARVGENTGEFPKEYEIPVLPRANAAPYFIPSTDRVYGTGAQSPVLTSPQTGAAPADSESSADDRGTAADAEPVYRQGKVEQEAYNLLVQSSQTVAGMIQGKDPALRFKGWAAARADEETFLVRLTFTQVADKADVPYIWQVKVPSRQVTPLNYYARSLPK